jgi:hypothetical protein
MQLEKSEARRNAVLEGMPHKVAANVLVILDDLDRQMEKARQIQEQEAAAAAAAAAASEASKNAAREQDGSGVCVCVFE